VKTRAFSSEKRELLELLLKEQEVGSAPAQAAVFHPIQIDGKDAFPLSFSQRRLWFLDQLEPGSAFYNFPLAVPFNNPVNTVVLEKAINEIVKRHEALRTIFTAVAGEPMQIILPELRVPLAIIDLRHLSREVQDTELIRLGAEMAQRPFDLASGPLLRTALLRRDQQEYIFVLVMHHVISDGWSLGVFWRELIELYNSFYVNRPSPLPDLAIQYADFAVWQRQRLQGEHLFDLLSYWKRKLSNIPVVHLPTDRPRPAVLSYRGAFQEIAVPGPLTHALRAISQREEATLFMTLFAAFAVLLQRYTGQDDIVVGSYVAGRDHAELEDLIGFFINTLVLRADLSGNPPFRTLLRRIRETALDAYAHQELPFEKLVEELQPERDLSRNPLFQVSFQLFSAQVDRSSPTVAKGAPTIDLNRGMAIFDIAVNIWDGPDALTGHIEYSTDLFDAATIARLAGHYQTLLWSIVTNPDEKLSALQILSEQEQRQLLHDWNETSATIPHFCVHQLFEQQVERSPRATAITVEGWDLSYDELNRRANRLTYRLRQLGVKREMPVGICVERGINMIVGILGILKAGGAYVPLDPSYPGERLTFMLEDSDARIVLIEERTASRLPKQSVATLRLDDERVFDGCNDANPETAATPEDLCYVIYTSGSTGKPKGVMSPHHATVNRLQWMWTEYPFEPGEIVCQKTALSFVDSIWELFGGLLKGLKTVVLLDETVKDPRKFITALAAAKVSRVVLVPSLLRALLNSGIDLANELPALKYWTASGEVLPYDVYAEFRQNVPGAKILNLYGSSEVAADVLCCDLSTTELTTRSVPVGRPISNTKVYVLDRYHNLVPIGVPGELYVGGQCLARGYHKRPDLNAEKFINVRLADNNNCLYKTGDLVRYRNNGQIEFVSRLDHQVKVRGHRIELGEIEATLSEHNQVGEVIASVVETAEDNRLIAYVVPVQGNAEAATDPRQELTSRWQAVWDETYHNSVHADGSFNIVGWNSSYTGEPIPPAEMHQWVDQTVSRALSFKPKRVLEIGCGTGLILLRVAPYCTHYVGTDFSKGAIDHVRREMKKTPGKFGHVHLYERSASDLEDLEEPFDLIIFNSVIQYFPNVEYLTNVLKKAICLTTPTGILLIGDVRSLPLLRALHTSVELQRAPDTLTVEVLQSRIQKQVAEENELAVHPALFHRFAPEIAQVTVDLKRGTLVNELIQFRYDVTLRRERALKAVVPDIWLDWSSQELSPDRLENTLLTERPQIIGITGIPNARTIAPLKAVELLETRSFNIVSEIRRRLRQSPNGGVDPEALWKLGEKLGYDVSIGLLGSGADGRYDVIFRRAEESSPPISFGFPSVARSNADVNQHVTNPAAAVGTQGLVAELRNYLQNRLPHHMIPAMIVLINALPRTPNGKVDRRALPTPDMVRGSLVNSYQPPRNKIERLLASIWAEVLNVAQVGTQDNFFELGGHSLLAIQLISRIRAEFNKELPVRAIFETPTISGLAVKLDANGMQYRQRQEITIAPQLRDPSRNAW
jgi:amino acid adenylation domain-containing protein